MADLEEKRSAVIAKAWKDPAFKKKLLKDPKSALKECGYSIPENMSVRVIEDTANTYTFVMPPSPTNARELSPAELETFAGSQANCCTNLTAGSR